MEKEEKEKCLQVIDILEQNEELKAFMDYNKDYFDEVKKKLNDVYYLSAAHFYKSLTFRFFRPKDELFRFLIGNFRCLCDSIVMENFGNSVVVFNRRIDYNRDVITKNLRHLYVDLKKQKLVDNFRNYINESINLVDGSSKSKDCLEMKKLTDQTGDFLNKMSCICKAIHAESSRLKDIRLMKQEGNLRRMKKIIRNRYLRQQQQDLSTFTSVKTDLDICYPESKEPSTEVLPILW